jgi:hypothetical protein
MKKLLWGIILLLSMEQAWGALVVNGTGDPADISRLALGTRQLAMGRTSVGSADDSGGFMLNPAGLAGIRSPEVTTMMTKLIGEFNFYHLSFVYPTQVDTFGISLLYEDPGEIIRVEDLDANGYPVDSDESIPAGTTLFTVGYGRKWSPDLYWGVSVKRYVQYLDYSHGTSTGADLGLIYTTPFRNVSLGFVAVNAIQQGLRWDTSDKQETSIPTYYKVGLAWELMNKQLTLALDDEIGRFNRLGVGAEYWPSKYFAFRAGNYGDTFSLGLGLRIAWFELDYAYTYELGPVDQTMYISMTFGDARTSELEQPEIYIMED